MPSATNNSPYKHLFPGFALDDAPQTVGELIRINATQIALGRKVTIVLLTPQGNENEQTRQTFQKQIRILSSLHHEHIPTVHNFGKAEGTLYAILTPVPRKTITEATQNSPVDQIEAALLIKKICLALQHALTSDIVLGNISPESIRLDNDANPSLPLLQQNPDENSPYNAPEIQNHNHTPTATTDIFALGILLYKLLTGETPEQKNTPPSSYKDTDPRFDTIFVKATHRNPKLRYQTPEEMAADLEHIALAISGKPSSSLASIATPPTSKRHYAAPAVRLAHPQKTTPVTITPAKKQNKTAPKKLYGLFAAAALTATSITYALSNHQTPTTTPELPTTPITKTQTTPKLPTLTPNKTPETTPTTKPHPPIFCYHTKLK